MCSIYPSVCTIDSIHARPTVQQKLQEWTKPVQKGTQRKGNEIRQELFGMSVVKQRATWKDLSVLKKKKKARKV